VLAREPERCRVALGLYLRRVFWSHPLHRVYALVPAALPQTRAYVDLLGACGFVHEGCLLGHLMVKGHLHDLDVFGLLRSDFEAWAQRLRPEWAL
jgi:RimJ/RimL family protein N-acetyltransferase